MRGTCCVARRERQSQPIANCACENAVFFPAHSSKNVPKCAKPRSTRYRPSSCRVCKIVRAVRTCAPGCQEPLAALPPTVVAGLPTAPKVPDTVLPPTVVAGLPTVVAGLPTAPRRVQRSGDHCTTGAVLPSTNGSLWDRQRFQTPFWRSLPTTPVNRPVVNHPAVNQTAAPERSSPALAA